MRPIPFAGIMCNPLDLVKEGDFKIKGILTKATDMPPLVRYEHFACKEERDQKFDKLMGLIKGGK